MKHVAAEDVSRTLVSVAICTLNRASLLSKTLSTFTSVVIPSGFDWELVIVDNGSSDETAAVVESFEGRLPIRREVELRRGQSVARNRVLSSYGGSFILWTDDDVEVDPQWITSTLDAFDAFEADVVFGRSFPVWMTSAPRWFGPLFAGQFALLDYGPEAFTVTDGEHQFYGLNMAFRRSAVETLGGFREDLGYVGNSSGGADDTDMFNRALTKGLRIVYAPQSVVGHAIPPDRTTKARQRRLAWTGARSNYRLVAQQFASLPQVFGLPRFMYRLAAADARDFVTNTLLCKASESFYNEIRLIRFAGLVKESFQKSRATLES